jgi:Ran GTPase-activating protein (RanGAP) involved in mRNA processing and transport
LHLSSPDGQCPQGGHELLHLQTNNVVKRSNLTKIPITPSIIKQVLHALAELDEMPAGLKITNRANHVIFDSAWIAGVDYDEDLFHDDDHNEEEDGDNNEDNEDEENYDEMDENDLPDILQQRNEFQIPH